MSALPFCVRHFPRTFHSFHGHLFRCYSQKILHHSESGSTPANSFDVKPVYSENEMLLKDIRTYLHSMIPLNTLRSVGNQLQPRAKVKWDNYIKEVMIRTKKTERELNELFGLSKIEEPKFYTGRARHSDTVEFEDWKDAISYGLMKLVDEPENLILDEANTFKNMLDPTYFGFNWRLKPLFFNEDELGHWSEMNYLVFPFEDKIVNHDPYDPRLEIEAKKIKKNYSLEEFSNVYNRVINNRILQPMRIAEEYHKRKEAGQNPKLDVLVMKQLNQVKSNIPKIEKEVDVTTKDMPNDMPNDMPKGIPNIMDDNAKDLLKVLFGAAAIRATKYDKKHLIPLIYELQTLITNPLPQTHYKSILYLKENKELRDFLQHHLFYVGKSIDPIPSFIEEFIPKFNDLPEGITPESISFDINKPNPLTPDVLKNLDDESLNVWKETVDYEKNTVEKNIFLDSFENELDNKLNDIIEEGIEEEEDNDNYTISANYDGEINSFNYLTKRVNPLYDSEFDNIDRGAIEESELEDYNQLNYNSEQIQKLLQKEQQEPLLQQQLQLQHLILQKHSDSELDETSTNNEEEYEDSYKNLGTINYDIEEDISETPNYSNIVTEFKDDEEIMDNGEVEVEEDDFDIFKKYEMKQKNRRTNNVENDLGLIGKRELSDKGFNKAIVDDDKAHASLYNSEPTKIEMKIERVVFISFKYSRAIFAQALTSLNKHALRESIIEKKKFDKDGINLAYEVDKVHTKYVDIPPDLLLKFKKVRWPRNTPELNRHSAVMKGLAIAQIKGPRKSPKQSMMDELYNFLICTEPFKE